MIQSESLSMYQYHSLVEVYQKMSLRQESIIILQHDTSYKWLDTF